MIGQSVGPFRVVRKLGAGGMGEVYLAEDTRLGRKVALKSPSESWLRDPDARVRLRREARAAARLNDPRIAAVYDVLDLDDRPYIVMEYVEGETLASLLRHGAFTVERAVAVGIQLTDALAVAHQGGVVHRDLKPGNVVVTMTGAVKILDFGLAKTAYPEDDGKDGLTHPGQLLGTPGYVAPEQLLGQPADARSDVYSAGAVLYQMLTGRAPFEQTDSMGRALAALMERPRPARDVNPAIPVEVSAVVNRAMATDPAERYQTAAEMRAALEHAATGLHDSPTRLVDAVEPTPRRRFREALQVAAAVFLLLAVAGIPIARWWKAREYVKATTSAAPVIAVLPFDNLSGDPKLEYLGAGMAETTSTKLASVPGISVVSRSEIKEALERNKELSKVCRALGVTFAVSGSVQEAGGHIQVSINILSGNGRIIVAGTTLEDTVANLFSLQRRIAEDVAVRVIGTISEADRARLARTSTSNVEAMSAYWRGRNLLEKPGLDNIDGAIAAFRQSITLDPTFALGFAGLTDAYWRKYAETKEPQWTAQALEAAEHARQLDPSEPDVRTALASVYIGIGRGPDAITELTRALELQPNNYRAHILLGDLHAAAGRTDEAVAQYNAAVKIRPDYWASYRSLGLALGRAGRNEEAIAAFRRITVLQPDWPFGYQLLGVTHSRMADFSAAAKDYETALAKGGSAATHSSLGFVYYYEGRFEEAAHAYENAIRLRPNNAVTHANLGDTYRRLGRTTDARREYTTALAMFEDELKVNPNSGASLASHATTLARLGRIGEAIDEAERAAVLAPGNQDVQYHRALTHVIARKPDRAIEALEQAVKGGYSLELLRHDTDLSALRGLPRFQMLLAGRGAASRRTQ